MTDHLPPVQPPVSLPPNDTVPARPCAGAGLSTRRAWLGGLSAASGLALTGCATPAPETAPSPTLPAPAAVVLPQAQRFDLRSRQGLDYQIFVAVPGGTPPPGGYPVLYLLDGNACFAAASDMLRMQLIYPPSSGVHPLLIVGVGYPGDKPLDNPRRAVDFVPVAPGQGSPEWVRYQAPSGGADAFLDFLVDELRPVLAAKFPLNLSRQSLAGHSLGGLFTLHALIRRPGAFRSYAPISPSIWVDPDGLAAGVDSLASRLSADKPVSVLQMVAGDEVPGRPERSAMMLSTARAIDQRLQSLAARGLSARMVELPGENHMSSFFCALPSILRQAGAASV